MGATAPEHDVPRSHGDDALAGVTLSTIRDLIGAIAAVGGLVFLSGGAVLALRLAFEDLPALGVVGQLPKGFLFSIGASQIVLPAIGLAAIQAVVLASRNRNPQERPRVWDQAGRKKLSRRRHLIFAAVAPVVVVLPGALQKLRVDPQVPRGLWWAVGVAVAVCALLAGLAYRLCKRGIAEDASVDADLLQSDERPKMRKRDYFYVSLGGAVLAALGAFIGWRTDANYRYLWLAAAWAGAVLATLGYLVVRGELNERYGDGLHEVQAGIALSLATAIVTVPALIAFWAAWPLETATVCATNAKESTIYRVDGVLVGETSDRLYIGDTTPASENIQSVPQSRVVRTVIGLDGEVVHCPPPS
jgi:hypothetical protein